MIRQLTLRRPTAQAWQVTADGVIPVEFSEALNEGTIRDVQVKGDDGRHTRQSVELATIAGPLYVVPGQWLLLTGMNQVLGMEDEMLDKVWRKTDEH